MGDERSGHNMSAASQYKMIMNAKISTVRAIKAASIKPHEGDYEYLPQTNINDDLHSNWLKLVKRARYFELSNPYAKRYLSLLKTHVVGHRGITIQCQFKKNGVLEKELSSQIENAFELWCRKGACDITKKYSFVSLQKMIIAGVARDGEIFIRLIRSNKGLILQAIDPIMCDVTISRTLANGYIANGIEFDNYGCPKFYIFNNKNTTERVSADNILHIFMPSYPTQSRGLSWLITIMDRLNHIDKYEEAELKSAIVASNKMGFFTQQDDAASGFTGNSKDGYGGNEDDETEIVNEARGNHFEILPEGVGFTGWNPEHPDGNYGQFVKSSLRGISTGLDVSYNNLASDLEGVNFSSMRSGTLEDRDNYKNYHTFMIDEFLRPVYQEWLKMACLAGILKIKATDIDNYLEPNFVPRTWDWIDPKKDIESNNIAVNMRVKSRRQVARESGRELEDVLDEIKEEEEMMKKYGIKPIDSSSSAKDVNDGQND